MLSNIYKIVGEIFNGGFTQDGFSVKGTSPCLIRVEYNKEVVHVTFVENLPEVSFTKNLGLFKPTLNIAVLGIQLNKNSGIIKLKNFIDIPFKYE